jgi:hypothetical protein
MAIGIKSESKDYTKSRYRFLRKCVFLLHLKVILQIGLSNIPSAMLYVILSNQANARDVV